MYKNHAQEALGTPYDRWFRPHVQASVVFL